MVSRGTSLESGRVVAVAATPGGRGGRVKAGHPDAALADPALGLSGQLRQRLGTWTEHVRGWTEHDLFPVEVVRYEDLLADPVGGFARIAAVADLRVSRDAITAAVTAASFSRLQAQEIRYGFQERPASGARIFGVAGW
jgi:hypothetical protein